MQEKKAKKLERFVDFNLNRPSFNPEKWKLCSLFIRFDEVLAELQFSFVCFLVGQHYDSFEHWKKLLVMLCTCEEAILEHPQLFMKLISEMYFQVRKMGLSFFKDANAIIFFLDLIGYCKVL